MRAVNLLPQEYRPKRGTGGRQGSGYVALGALGALLLCTLLYAVTARQVGSREHDAAAANQQAQQAEARAAAAGPYGSFAQIQRTRALSVKALAGARFDWERLMREVALVLPDGAWLTELDASVAPQEDAAASQAAGGGPTAKLAGCAPRQSDVARIMVRLRGLHMVSDVTLAESKTAPEAATGSSAVAGPPGAAAADGCGDQYEFDLTVAFEALPPVPGGAPRSVPARLGGGS